MLSVNTLRNVLIEGGSELKYVFISACYSAAAAKAFVDAGVPHVIAVQVLFSTTDCAGASGALT